MRFKDLIRTIPQGKRFFSGSDVNPLFNKFQVLSMNDWPILQHTHHNIAIDNNIDMIFIRIRETNEVQITYNFNSSFNRYYYHHFPESFLRDMDVLAGELPCQIAKSCGKEISTPASVKTYLKIHPPGFNLTRQGEYVKNSRFYMKPIYTSPSGRAHISKNRFYPNLKGGVGVESFTAVITKEKLQPFDVGQIHEAWTTIKKIKTLPLQISPNAIRLERQFIQSFDVGPLNIAFGGKLQEIMWYQSKTLLLGILNKHSKVGIVQWGEHVHFNYMEFEFMKPVLPQMHCLCWISITGHSTEQGLISLAGAIESNGEILVASKSSGYYNTGSFDLPKLSESKFQPACSEYDVLEKALNI